MPSKPSKTSVGRAVRIGELHVVRGSIIQYLEHEYPKTLPEDILLSVMQDRSDSPRFASHAKELMYLVQRGYVERIEGPFPGRDPGLILYRLTANGHMLASGEIIDEHIAISTNE